ncbi:MAG TPA: nitronate monooxygenase [Nitrospirae bacterium]|nr:nitronate monooxygenase [Nitrospirota bacterium]
MINKAGKNSVFQPLVIKDIRIELPIIQGGMGVGVSLYPLASAVAAEGGAGIISSAALDRLLSKRYNKRFNTYDATYAEISLAKSKGGVAGINIMVALARDYKDSVRGAVDAGADMIISGAGLPLSLPSIARSKHTALIPIVSSARALNIICKKWQRQGYLPDAAVLEGPLAGGHLGFHMDQINLEENRLENLLPPVKDMAKKFGDFPIIVAGGIYTNADIKRFLDLGADGVQMGTRFLATVESSATPEYKDAVISADQEDIIVTGKPGSPCGLPFRVIKHSPMYQESLNGGRPPKCNKGFVLLKDEEGKYTRCPAKEDYKSYFCICNGLLSSAGYNPDKEKPLYTVGTNAYLVNRIVPVKDLMDDLKGIPTPAASGSTDPR